MPTHSNLGDNTMESDIVDVKKRDKKSSKKRKREKRLKSDASNIEVQNVEIDNSPVNPEQQGKKEKKEKKKKTKKSSNSDKDSKNEETAASSLIDNAEQQEKKKKKKKKKVKSGLPVAEASVQQNPVDAAEEAQLKENNASAHKDRSHAEKWRQDNNITIQGSDCDPIQSFDNTPFPDYLLNFLKQSGFTQPTPIQAQSWPVVISGKDLIGIAETGSGKTLAFILPAIMRINSMPRPKNGQSGGPLVLVLAPTRELAQQIDDVSQKVCAHTRPASRSVCIFGGVPKQPQTAVLRSKPEIVIATPGRLIDHMDDGTLDLSRVCYLVLDEADRMLDMGFEPQIRRILGELQKGRQTLMFSATWPPDVQRLAKLYITDPARVTVGSETLSASHQVRQVVQVCEPYEKKKMLRDLLNEVFVDRCRILIFMLYKKSCARMFTDLEAEGWPVVSIHGDLPQATRNKVILDFKEGRSPILIATDVAARGLDVKGVKYVINVEFPLRCEDYVHRIGRTGRAGEVGTSYTFFTQDDKAHARELVQILQEAKQEVDPTLLALADKAPGIKPKKTAMEQLYGDFGKVRPDLVDKRPTRIVFDD